MRRRIEWGGIGLAALLAVAVAGCPKNEPVGNNAPSGGGGGPSGKRLTIAVIPKGTKHQFWQAVNAGAQKAASEENVEAQWGAPPNEDSIGDQVNYVENKITSGADGIVLAATDAHALVKPVQDAKAKGIPVVLIDSGIDQPDAGIAYIATNNVRGGEAAAEALAKAIGEKGNVGLLIFKRGSVSSDEREKGFKQGITKYPNIHLVQQLEANDPQKAGDAALTMLTAHPDIAGIFAANEPNGVGAANALRQKGLTGKVKLVAYDSSDEEVKAIQDGTIQATVVQDPFKMGYLGMKTVLKAIRKQAPGPKVVDSGMMVITKDNMNTPEAQKLLHPQ